MTLVAEYCYAITVFIAMGNVVMLSTVSQLLKCFAMIFMLNAVMLSVMAPAQYDDIQLNGTQHTFIMKLIQIP
jgi:hypothetical protein